jgi:hypothetical protein
MNKSYKTILSLSFGCFISAASYAAAPLPYGAPGAPTSVMKYASKNYWSPEEDNQLRELVRQLGTDHDIWKLIASLMPGRTAAQCRHRWNHYLKDPNFSSSIWTKEEDDLLLRKYGENPKWRQIAAFFPGRSANQCQNRRQTLRRHAPQTSMALPQQPMVPPPPPQQMVPPPQPSSQSDSDADRNNLFPSNNNSSDSFEYDL